MNSSSPPKTPSEKGEDTTESSLADEGSPVTPADGPAGMPSPSGRPPSDDRATGHYGPGYGDPTRHQGNDLPPPKKPSG